VGVATTNEMNAKTYPANLTKIFDGADQAAKEESTTPAGSLLIAIPQAPALNPVATPTNADLQVLSGTKDAGHGHRARRRRGGAPGPETTWSCSVPLKKAPTS